MANTKPIVDNEETLRYVLEEGKKTGIHVLSCAAISKGFEGKERTDMEGLLKAGAAGFTDDGIPLMDGPFVKEAMEEAARLDTVLSFHEEDKTFIKQNGINHGKVSDQLGIYGSPALAEDSLVARDCMIALATGAKIDIQHISSGHSVEMVRLAKKMGAHVWAEVTPHHFTLTEDAVLEHGTLAKMNPPLRTEWDRQMLIEGLKDGTIDMIATDHAPHSKEEKHFSIFSYVEFCLWNAMDDMTNFQRNYSTGEVEIHGSAIYHKTEYRERRNHYAVYSVNAPIAGFDTSRDAFLGAYGENSAPEVVVSGSCKNSVASGWAPVGSHQLDVTLAPGESRTYVFVLGYVENPAAEKWVGRPEDGIINRTPAEKLLEKFNTTEKADQALADLKAYWEKLLSHFTVSSKEEKLDRMVNIWHQYQCMVTFNMSRSASYYESGIGRGMGFRDSCQDLLGFVHLIPDRARQRILDIASTQFEDGSAYHQYQPLTKKGNSDIGSGFNDDPLWLIAGTAAYIKETGDYSILDERTPYDNDDSKATDLMEHLRRSFHYTMEHRGPHKLPLIGIV